MIVDTSALAAVLFREAALNLGDCFAYALARKTGEPLLFRGEDFARTDIEAA